MRTCITLLIILIALTAIAEEDSLQCYKEKMVDGILRIGNRGYVFETYEKWGEDGNDRDLLNRDFRWAFRDGSGNILDDTEFLAKVGQEDAAERMAEYYRSRKRTGNLRLIIGTPLGLAMTAAGAYWMKLNFDETEPSTLDQAGAVVLGVTGIGVTTTALISFFTTRSIDPYDHEITRRQALDMIDRHNNASASRCKP